MEPKKPVTKKKRPRKVFGRVQVVVSGNRFTVELNKSEMKVKAWHRRNSEAHVIPLSRLILVVMQNAPLRQK